MSLPNLDPVSLATTLAAALETMCFVIADPVDAADPLDVDRHASITIGDEEGAWKLFLSASDGVLVEIASGLMGLDPDELDVEQVLPGMIMELANIFGGEVINLLGGEECPLRPGIPCLEPGAFDGTPGSTSIALDAMGDALTVSFVPYDAGSVERAPA